MNPLNTNGNTLALNKLSYNSASQVFVELKFETPTTETRMKQANFDAQPMQTTHRILFKVTMDIRHYILPPNATLFRDSFVQQQNCHLCFRETQTLKYFF